MFDTNISAIDNSLARQAVVAQNVANLNTKGYKEKGTNNTNSLNAQSLKNAQNNVDLPKQLVNANLNLIDLKANVAVLKSQNKMLGSLLDVNI